MISRTNLYLTAALAATLLSASLTRTHAQEPTPSAATPATTPAAQDLIPAILPTDRFDLPWWAERHNAIIQTVAKHPDVRLLLIGDSITQNYEKSLPPDQDFQSTWRQFYEPRHALNLGFSGDTTANVLWRITHGEIDGLRPQAAVVLIGTNNTGHAHQTAEQTEAGISNIVSILTQRLPQTRILLLGILPSNLSPEKTAADQAINAWLAKRYGKDADKKAGKEIDPHVTYLDISSIFMTSSGAGDANNTINASLFCDPRLPHPGKPLHPDTVGQRKMAEAIEPTLAKLMYDKPRITTSVESTPAESTPR